MSFKQYLTLKASKFGIKIYKQCDAVIGYFWSFLVYAGKDTELSSSMITLETSKTTTTLLKLLEPLLKQGQTVWMANFYNSSCLTIMLKTVHKTDYASTLKLNQKNVPKSVTDTKLEKR
jgi:hypothetical protein